MYQIWAEKFTQMRTEIFDASQTLQPDEHILKSLALLSKRTDAFILQLWADIAPSDDTTTLIAVGGYGREELFPHSDIDLIFHTETPLQIENGVEIFLMVLRDARMKVGHAVRTEHDATTQIRAEFETAVSYLDARTLRIGTGPDAIYFKELAITFLKNQNEEKCFNSRILEDFKKRRKRFGRTIYLLEPEIKRGPGGLRDLQAIRWVNIVNYDIDPLHQRSDEMDWDEEQYDTLLTAFSCLAKIRWWVHLLSKRERLRFDIQEKISKYFEYPDAKSLMQHYYLEAQKIRKMSERLLRKNRNFPYLPIPTLDTDHAIFETLRTFERENRLLPASLDKQIEKYVAHWDTHDSARNKAFADLLFDPNTSKRTSQRLFELGILTRLLPEFAAIECHVHHDVYHVYTTDAHSIHCLEFAKMLLQNTNAPESTPSWILDIARAIQRPRVFLIAALTHDIGKNRGGSHAAIGADLARSFCPRLGFNAKDTDTISFLILEHLTLSHAARRLDINDPRVQRDIVSLVHSRETLDLLMLLTYCDIATVNPEAMNDWTATLLRQLYERVSDVLEHGFQKRGEMSRETIAEKTQQLRDESNHDANTIERFTRSLPAAYLEDTKVKLLTLQLQALKKFETENRPQFIVEIDSEMNLTELIVVCRNHPGILANIAGTMTASGVNIFSAIIVSSAKNYIIDSFFLGTKRTDAAYGPVPALRMQKALENLENVLLNKTPLTSLLTQYLSASKTSGAATPSIIGRVNYINTLSDTFTVFEVRAEDRIGLLYEITHFFAEAEIDITRSKIDSEGATIIDTFFVQTNQGTKLSDEEAKEISEKLLEIL